MSNVEFTASERVGTLVLNRPEAANALNWEVVRRLEEVCEEAAAADVDAIVVRSSGTTFSAGLDRREMSRFLELAPEDLLEERHGFYARLARILRLPVPTIAVVEGPAVTGGVGLAALCDFRLATSSAWFKVTFNELGFYPGLGLSVTLDEVGGRSLARRMLLLGERIEAQEAHRTGLVDWLVEAEEVEDKLSEILAWVGSGDRLVVRMIKDRLDSELRNRVDTALHEEALGEAFNAQTATFRSRADRFMNA